jgi:hypothetical protein
LAKLAFSPISDALVAEATADRVCLWRPDAPMQPLLVMNGAMDGHFAGHSIGHSTLRPTPRSTPLDAAFSYDGKFLAVLRDRIHLWQLTGSTHTPIPLAPLDTKTLGGGRAEGLLHQGGDALTQFAAPVEYMAWNPVGHRLACYAGHRLYLWDVAAMTAIAQIELHNSIQGLSWHPDGSVLAIAQRSSVQFWDAHRWQRRYVWEMMAPCTAMAWNSTGQWLAAAMADGTLGILDWPRVKMAQDPSQPRATWASVEPKLLRGFAGAPTTLTWTTPKLLTTGTATEININTEVDIHLPSPSTVDWLAASAGDRIALWPIDASISSSCQWLPCDTVRALAFQPGTQCLAIATLGGLTFWPESAASLEQTPVQAPVDALAWHPNGHSLAALLSNGTVSFRMGSADFLGFL